MIVTKYLSKTYILPHMLVANKSDVIKELTHLIFEKKRIKGMGMALDQVVAREVMESTGIGHGVAIPHARIAGIKTLICAVGRVPSGIDFLSVDRKPANLIFLILYPPTQQTTYLNFVATLVKLLRVNATRKALMTVETAEEIFDVLDQASKSFADDHEAIAGGVEADPDIAQMPDTHADLILMARLQFYEEMLAETRTGKGELRKRIEKIRSLVDPRILRHYDRLMKSQPPALVPVEADTCQGCFMRLPSKFAQQVRQDVAHIHTCMNCSRFIYVI
ncbi:MAG: PTS transporter subunit EIIA [Nitrospiraceae bacterium]|nr:PTS transporter subunit EIIA [Nitrospiraceae bacterium]